ncbi:hypothetical protein PHET_04479 [Paragonimus heterotremus]|uniref:Uncharacterized protein n=1 Tax=Paragonimus heterotremus TaxID=100268 RepID=A0A8J4SQL3_9TREM|nr:hypothetical protein PHET_04479 [Paragonimus heterotremus]
MRSQALLFSFLVILLAIYNVESISKAEMEEKLRKILGNMADEDEFAPFAEVLVGNSTIAEKEYVIDRFSEHYNLPVSVRQQLKALLRNEGSHRTVSIFLLSSIMMVHLIVA